MAARARILIICHEHDRALLPHYIMAALADRWRADGHDVRIQFGWHARPAADVVIPHLDVTRMPPAALALLNSYPVVLNRALSDIGKRRISRNLVSRSDPWPGPVIVKTDANHAGVPDAARRRPRRGFWRWLTRRPRPPIVLPPRPPQSYRIFEHIAAVPPEIWHDPDLVVEKFRPERDGDRFVVRQWIVLGRQVIERRMVSTQPIAPPGAMVEFSEDFVPEPPELRDWRARIGFDYGKFDFARPDGELVVFDVGTTPTSRATNARPANVAHLAAGLAPYIGQARARP